MNRFLIILAAWLGLAGAACAQVATTNLQAYWKFDSANILADAHGSNTLTNNGTTGTTTGKINEAGSFNGTTQYLSIADNAALSMGDINFSVACWVYLSSTAADQYIVSKYTTTGNQREYAIQYVNATGSFRFLVSSAGTSGVLVDGPGSMTTGTWYFVAGGHNATSNDIWISVNAATPVTASHSTGVFDGTSEVNIGARPTAASLLTGRVDEASIWKRDIRSDLSALYNSGSGLAYPFNASSPVINPLSPSIPGSGLDPLNRGPL